MISTLPTILGVSPVERISCSEFLDLQQCMLKALARHLMMSGSLPEEVPNRAGIVGSFHHRAMEQAFIASSVEDLDRRLELEIHAAQVKASAWSHLRAIGSLSGWDEINRSCTASIRLFRRRTTTDSGATVRAEQTLASRDGLLVGRLDRFSIVGHRAILVDYKTATLAHDDSLRASYVLQLKLYSVLLRDTYGVDVVDASIEARSGAHYEFRLDAAEIDEFGLRVRDTIKATNDRIAQTTDVLGLAAPSTEGCEFCRLQPICGAFKARQGDLSLKGDQFVLDATLRYSDHEPLRPFLTAVFEPSVGWSKDMRVAIPSSHELADLKSGRRYVITRLRKNAVGVHWTPMSQVFGVA